MTDREALENLRTNTMVQLWALETQLGISPLTSRDPYPDPLAVARAAIEATKSALSIIGGDEETWAEWDDLDPAAIVASVKP